MFSDPSGEVSNKVLRSFLYKKIVKPLINKCEEALSDKDLTYSEGISVCLSPAIWNFNAQAGFSIDTKGNFAIQGTFAGGVTTAATPGGSISAYRLYTNAPSVFDLEGSGYQVGGSLCVPTGVVPLYAGAELNIFPSEKYDKNFYGRTTCVGIGTPGAEFHGEWGETHTLYSAKTNLFDAARSLCDFLAGSW